MKRDDTKKNFTALSGNGLKTVHHHYLSFPCFIAFVTISEVCGVMRNRSVTNALFRFFCSENRNFLVKIALSDNSITTGIEGCGAWLNLAGLALLPTVVSTAALAIAIAAVTFMITATKR